MPLIHHFASETATRLMSRRKTVLLAGLRLGELAQTCRYDALAAVADDPAGYGALVLDCDDPDGIEAVLVSVRLLRSIAPGVPAILVPYDRPLALAPMMAGPGR
jgi:hypothetical protein